MSNHDALYHRLFSHPGMVAQLLREFVSEPWVGELELDEMERVNAKFHAEDGERRESDVVWRIPLRGGGDAYLLLEFQSTQDRWMALRIMVYAGLLWQHIIRGLLWRHIIRKKRLTADGRLPPVFPLVVYNGDSTMGDAGQLECVDRAACWVNLRTPIWWAATPWRRCC